MHFFFLKFQLENQHAYYTWNLSYEVICITRQKYKVEQLPILWNWENESKQDVCLASCIISVDVNHSSVIQLESCRSTITIENLLHFLQYFDDKINYMKILF